MHGSRGRMGNCKSRALALKPWEANEFLLPFFLHFQSALQSKIFDLRYLPVFFLPVHEMRVLPPLVWTRLLGFNSATPSFLSFPSIPFRFLPHLLQHVGWRWGWLYNLEKKHPRERDCTRLFIATATAAASFNRLRPAAGRYVYKDTAL
jgi:hypothetical protein